MPKKVEMFRLGVPVEHEDQYASSTLTCSPLARAVRDRFTLSALHDSCFRHVQQQTAQLSWPPRGTRYLPMRPTTGLATDGTTSYTA